MKKLIVNILVFFAIVAVIDIGVGYAGDYLHNHAKGGETRKLNVLVMNDCHDVVVLGSSRAYSHYDAPFLSDTLGLDVYNAGYEGNGVVLAYGLLSMMLDRYQPKLVLFDLEPAFDIIVYEKDNNHKRYIAPLKPYYRINEVGEVIKEVSTEEWYKVHSGMIRYNTTILSMGMDYSRTYDNSKSGYGPLQGSYQGEPKSKAQKQDDIDGFKLSYIQKLLALAQEHHVPIAVVASPKYGQESSDVLQPVKEICENMGVPFLDYYADNEFMKHKEWFKEPMHLNEVGARYFSQKIVEEIGQLIKM